MIYDRTKLVLPADDHSRALPVEESLRSKRSIRKKREIRRAIYGIMLLALVLTGLAITGEQWLVACNSLVLLAVAIVQLQLVNLRIHA